MWHTVTGNRYAESTAASVPWLIYVSVACNREWLEEQALACCVATLGVLRMPKSEEKPSSGFGMSIFLEGDVRTANGRRWASARLEMVLNMGFALFPLL